MPHLQRFSKNLPPARLGDVLDGARWPTESVPTRMDLDQFRSAVGSVADATGPAIDRLLVEPLHRALPLSRREAADPLVWQYLCVQEVPDLVWRRWNGELPQLTEQARLVGKVHTRFLCRPSLGGMSRNTLARLWWAAEHLGDYALARTVLARQDMYQAIFERFFGMYEPAARACVRRFEGRAENEIRTAAKWLQQCAATTALECLDETQITEILDEAWS